MLVENAVILFLEIVCSYTFIKLIIDERGFGKAKAIILWIVLYDILMIQTKDPTLKWSNVDYIMIIVGLMSGCVLSLMLVMKSNDTWMKFCVVISWFLSFGIISFSALTAQKMNILYIFKVLLMLTLLIALIALCSFSTLWQIVGAIIAYIIMFGVNAMLSKEFLNAVSENRFWEGIYETIQRSYCLNVINNQVEDTTLIVNIIDFVVCKVMDVIMLGFLSAKFMEIVDKSKSDGKYPEKPKHEL